MSPEAWDQLASEPVFEAPHYRVRRDTLRLPSGRIVNDYTVGELGDYALVVAITHEKRAVLVRQWKQGVRRITLELPGGMIEKDETEAEAALRELREETGFSAPQLERLGAFDVDASKSADQGHVFLALGAERLHVPEQHEMEAPEVVLVPLANIPGLIDRGEIRGGASVAGLLQALRRVPSLS